MLMHLIYTHIYKSSLFIIHMLLSPHLLTHLLVCFPWGGGSGCWCFFKSQESQIVTLNLGRGCITIPSFQVSFPHFSFLGVPKYKSSSKFRGLMLKIFVFINVLKIASPSKVGELETGDYGIYRTNNFSL